MIDILTTDDLLLIIQLSVALGIATAINGVIFSLRDETRVITLVTYSSSIGNALALFFVGTTAFYVNMLLAIPIVILILAISKAIEYTKKVSKSIVTTTMTTVSFATVIVLLSYIDRNFETHQINFTMYLLGNIRLFESKEINLIFYISMIIAILSIININRIKQNIFDKHFLVTNNLKYNIFNIMLIIQLIITVIASSQIVGIVFAPGFIILPVIIIQYFVKSLLQLFIFSSLLSSVSVFVGIYGSLLMPLFSTGVVIILTLTIFVLILLSFRFLMYKRSIKKNILKVT